MRIVIDASRNRSGGAIAYLKNFIKNLNLKNTNVKEIIIFSQKEILKQIQVLLLVPRIHDSRGGST